MTSTEPLYWARAIQGRKFHIHDGASWLSTRALCGFRPTGGWYPSTREARPREKDAVILAWDECGSCRIILNAGSPKDRRQG